MNVELKNDQGVIKKVKVGFSWTIFFFGMFPLFYRGLALHGLILFITSFPTFGISWLVYAFIGNKITATHYLEKGYKRIGGGWDYANQSWGFDSKS